MEHQGGSGGGELDDDFSNLLTTDISIIGDDFSDLIVDGEDLMTNPTGPPPNSATFRISSNTGIPNEYGGILFS